MIQKEFACKVVEIVKKDSTVIGLAAAGSWATDELDEFSDLDLILVTKEKIGDFISGFTGEHVGGSQNISTSESPVHYRCCFGIYSSIYLL